MAEQLAWEKPNQSDSSKSTNNLEKYKFLIGGALMLAAVAYLIISGTATGAQYFTTIDQLVGSPEYIGQTVRISGAVIGDEVQCNNYDDDTSNNCDICDPLTSICHNPQDSIIEFTIAYIPQQTDNLELTLHQAVETARQNPGSIVTLTVHYEDTKPDLLQNEAQAILTGVLRDDGIFYATELLLKCPSRYGEEVPGQTDGEET